MSYDMDHRCLSYSESRSWMRNICFSRCHYYQVCWLTSTSIFCSILHFARLISWPFVHYVTSCSEEVWKYSRWFWFGCLKYHVRRTCTSTTKNLKKKREKCASFKQQRPEQLLKNFHWLLPSNTGICCFYILLRSI